ncbi:MAG: YDG domain-containing protein, partial [Eubacterium sp.]
ILPKEVSVTAEAKDRSYIKDNVDAEVTLTVNGANAEDEITATYETAVFADDAVGIDKEVTVTGIALAGEKAGNYTLPEAGQTVQTQASISTATIEIKALPTVTGGLIYGDQLKNEALTLENDGVAVSKNGEESVLIDGAFSWKNPEQVLSDIGEADAVVLFTATNLEEYGTAEATVKVNVAKKPITINPEADQTKVYNSADPTSYKFSVDETTPLVGDDFLLEVLTREAGEDVGTYAYSLSTEATENTHYTMTLGSDAAKFEITKATPQALSVPELDSKTAKTITLKTVEVSDPIAIAAKAIIEYGITEGENETIWQDSPSFVDLAGSTTYKFVVRYKATNNTEASTVSEALEVTTETAGTPVETTTITGLPEGGIEGINVTSDKDEQMVNVGDTIVYTLKGNSARNTYVPYSFSVNGASLKFELKDKATRTYEATYEVTDISAPIKGEAGYVLLGDFSGDKKINIIDAQQIAQYAGLSSEEKEKYSADKIAAGNVDFNTVVNIIDAQKIAQYASDENMNF